MFSSGRRGKPLIVYVNAKKAAETCGDLARQLEGLHYWKDWRTGGLPTNSRIFGYSPRNTIRADYCTAAKLNSEEQLAYASLLAAADVAGGFYSRYAPDVYDYHMEKTETLLPDWRLGRYNPFTSGIINKNNQLRYHYDTGNIKNVWSAMFVFKKNVSGGHLNVPMYDAAFELKNNSLFLFDGQSILHGVTPIKMLNKNSYRISVVYYSLERLWKCLTPKEELARIRKLKTVRELGRARA